MRPLIFLVIVGVLAIAIEFVGVGTNGFSYYTYYPEEKTFQVNDGAVYYNSKGSIYNVGCQNGFTARYTIIPYRPTPRSTTALEYGIASVYDAYPNADKYAICFGKPTGTQSICWVYTRKDYEDVLTTKITDMTFCNYRVKQIALAYSPEQYDSIAKMEQSAFAY